VEVERHRLDRRPDESGLSLAELFAGDDRRSVFAATPSTPNGSGAELGSITTTYVDATVQYQP